MLEHIAVLYLLCSSNIWRLCSITFQFSSIISSHLYLYWRFLFSTSWFYFTICIWFSFYYVKYFIELLFRCGQMLCPSLLLVKIASGDSRYILKSELLNSLLLDKLLSLKYECYTYCSFLYLILKQFIRCFLLIFV